MSAPVGTRPQAAPQQRPLATPTPTPSNNGDSRPTARTPSVAGGSNLDMVAQCSRCGTLTMMARCPNCDAPTQTPSTVSSATNPVVPVTNPPTGRSPSATTWSVSEAPTTGPAVPMGRLGGPGAPSSRSPSATSTSRPEGGIVPTPAPVHRPLTPQQQRVSVQQHQDPTQSTTTPTGQKALAPPGTTIATANASADLHREVERLGLELQRKEAQLQEMRVEVDGKALTKHELQELWRTVNEQNGELDAARKRDQEMLLLREKYNGLLAEKDRWMLDSITRQEQASEAISKAGADTDHLRDEIRRLQQELEASRAETVEAKKEAQTAENMVNQLKGSAQRMTEEVLELQRAVVASGEQEHQEVAHLRGQIAEYEDMKRLFESEMLAVQDTLLRAKTDGDAFKQEIANLKTEASHRELQTAELESKLKLSEIELRAAQDDLIDMRQTVTQLKENTPVVPITASTGVGVTPTRPTESHTAGTSPMTPPPTPPPQPQPSEAISVAASEHIAKLEQQLATVTEIADQIEVVDAQRLEALELVDELRNELNRVSNTAKTQLQESEGQRKYLKEQVDILTDEVRALASEATSSTAASEETVHKFEKRLKESRDAEQRTRIDNQQLHAELQECKAKLTSAESEVAHTVQMLEELNVTHRAAAAEAEKRSKAAHEQQLHDVQSHLDTERRETTSLRRRLQEGTDAYTRQIDDLNKDLAAAKSDRERLQFEVDRLKLNPSPQRLNAQREDYEQQLRHTQLMREDAEKRLAEQSVVIESLQKDLSEARVARSAAENTSSDKQSILVGVCAVVGAANAEDLLPRIKILHNERDALRDERDAIRAATSSRVADLEDQLLRAANDKEKVVNQASTTTTKLQEVQHAAEMQKTSYEAKLAEAAAESEREKDWLTKEMDNHRVNVQREKDEHAATREKLNGMIQNLEITVKDLQMEKDTLSRTASQTARDLERTRSAQQEAVHACNAAKNEVQNHESTITTMDVQIKEHLKTIERLKSDKTRLLAEISASKSTSESEASEMRTRLDDQMQRHQKEYETLRASLRVERDKVLKEVEATHAVQSKLSECEMQLDAIKAERDRFSKEVEHIRRANVNRSEVLQQSLDESLTTQEALRREADDTKAKYQSLLREFDAVQYTNRQQEDQLQQAAQQRDQLASQIDSYRLERDAAVRTAMEFSTASSVSKVQPPPPPSHMTPRHQYSQPPPAPPAAPPVAEYTAQYSSAHAAPPIAATYATPGAAAATSSGVGHHRGTSPMLFDRPAPSSSRGTSPAVASSQAPAGTIHSNSMPAALPPQMESHTARERNDALFAHFREQHHNNSAAMKMAQDLNTSMGGTAIGNNSRQSSPMGQPLSAYR